MRSVISALATFSVVMPLLFAVPVYALKIDNPYLKQTPSIPLPIPVPTNRQTRTPRTYNPQMITPEQSPQTDTGPNANHIQWCQTRYPSYRLSDNSYIPPGGGGRVDCNSPFGP